MKKTTLSIFAGILAFALSLPAQEEMSQLAPFVVTGTRTERVQSETPVKTELLLADDVERYNVTSFREALKLIPTARFENDCQNCGLNQVQLLGLSTEYTAILFDGASLYSGLAKVYGADLFPAIFIDRIEVVKGGSSVLYGPEAMAGVVNLITDEPLETGFKTRVGYDSILGDADEYEASFIADYVDPDGLYSLSLYGLWNDREGLDLSGDGFTEIPEFNNNVVGGQAWWHPIDGADLKVTYQYMDQSHRGGDRLDLPEEQARVAESLAHNLHIAQAIWTQRINAGLDYRLGFSYPYIDRDSFYGARGDNEQRAFEEAGNTGDVTEAFIAGNQAQIDQVARQVWGYTENHVYYFDSQVNHYWGDHTVSYGLQYRYEDLTDGPLFTDISDAPVTEDSFDNLGVFLQDQWAVTDRFELVPGIRVDEHSNANDRIFSPRVAARFDATKELTLRASWSTGFNAPGAFNEDKHIGVNNGGAIFLRNAPGLEEESSETFSFGGDFVPAAFNQDLILHSQVHYTQLEDAFEIDDSDPNNWLRINGPDATIFVWENNVNWEIDNYWSVDAGLSYIDAEYEEPIERVTGLTTDEFIKRPNWTGHLGVTYENHDLFDASALLGYTGSMIAVGEDADIWRHTPDFWVLDLGISKHFDILPNGEHLEVAIGVENAFDDRQEDLQNNGEDRDPTYLYGPWQPRTYYVRVTAQW